jgi:uncharacterized protein
MFTPFVRWIKNHDLLTYFVLTFLITWGCWITVILTLPGRDIKNLTPVGMLMEYIGLWGPALAAILVAAVTRGKAGMKALFGRLLIWRVPGKWYLLALILWPVISILAAFWHASVTNRPLSLDWSRWTTLGSVVLGGLLVGYHADEEIGWRGFALPRLLERWNALTASIVLGVIWGLWHLPGMFVLQVKGMESPIPFYTYLIFTVSLSILITWFFNHTRGSLIFSMFIHWGGNAIPPYLNKLLPLSDPGNSMFIYRTWIMAAAAILVVTLFGYRTFTRRRDVPLNIEMKTNPITGD